MRTLVSCAAIALIVAGCGTSSSNPGPTPRPTVKGAPVSHVGPIPASSPVKGAPPAPTVNPHATVGHLPSPTPLPSATAIPATAFTAYIQGVVLDAKSRAPVPGALITVGANLRTTHADAYGHYKIAYPGSVPVPLFASAHGYTGGLAMGKIQPHHHTTVDFALNPIQPGKPAVPPAPIGFGTP